MESLRPKQQRFVEEYVIDWNGAQAAIRAGYAAGSAKVTACRLLTNANVKRALNELKERIRVACYNNAIERVEQHRSFLGQIADENSVAHSNEESCDITDWSYPGAEIKKSETRDHETIEISFESRTAAIDHLLKLSEEERL